MATNFAVRSLLYRPSTHSIFSSLLSRSFSSSSAVVSRPASLFRALRPLSAAASRFSSSSFVSRSLSTRATNSSLNDPSPNWSNRPPKETILLDGCDFEHWLVVMEKPEGDPTRDEIIDSYIKTLAAVVGSEEEARYKIYSVSTRHYFAFGALVSEELSYKLKELPRVRWVLPDSYLDVRNKDYGGEPFIDGQAVPYDPKYHEEWVRNNARANERNRRNDRPRNFDRSRNYDRRRENSQNQNFQNQRGPPPLNNQGMPQNNQNNMSGMQQNYPPQQPNYNRGPPPQQQQNMVRSPPLPHPQQQNYREPQPPQQNSYGSGPSHFGNQPNNMGGAPNNMGGAPMNNNMGGAPNNMGGAPMNNNMGGPPNNMGGAPMNNNMGRIPSNQGWSNGMPENYQNVPNNGGMPPQGAPSNYQNDYGVNSEGGMPGRNNYY